LHRLGVVGRSLRAANALVSGQGPWVSCRLTFPPRTVECVPWLAPEEVGASGCLPGHASDVHALGGLLVELLTAGAPPFHWLAKDPAQLALRRASDGPVHDPRTGATLAGLLGVSCIEAAAVDGVLVPWCVRAYTTPGSPRRLEDVKALVLGCLAPAPAARLALDDVRRRLESLLQAEAPEAFGSAWWAAVQTLKGRSGAGGGSVSVSGAGAGVAPFAGVAVTIPDPTPPADVQVGAVATVAGTGVDAQTGPGTGIAALAATAASAAWAVATWVYWASTSAVGGVLPTAAPGPPRQAWGEPGGPQEERTPLHPGTIQGLLWKSWVRAPPTRSRTDAGTLLTCPPTRTPHNTPPHHSAAQ
jgi:hypothetical protein